MEGTVIAAIIAASIAALTSIANICLSIHRNKQDGITSYRMQWIHDVRNEFANLFGWTVYVLNADGTVSVSPLDDLRVSANKIGLFMNIKDNYDKEIIDKTFEYLEIAQRLQKNALAAMQSHSADSRFNAMYENAEQNKKLGEIRQELREMVRLYLKVEWTRVKCESSVNKFKYCYCWSILKGFQSDKALNKFRADLEEIKK